MCEVTLKKWRCQSLVINVSNSPRRRIDLQTGTQLDGDSEAADKPSNQQYISSAAVDETNEAEPVSDSRFAKRPVSMFEPREGIHNAHKALLQLPESRTTSSMYQMAETGAKPRDTSLPPAEEVKHRTDVVTRRIQELWTAMQDQVRDAVVPGAERIRIAIEELTAIFPQVNISIIVL